MGDTGVCGGDVSDRAPEDAVVVALVGVVLCPVPPVVDVPGEGAHDGRGDARLVERRFAAGTARAVLAPFSPAVVRVGGYR